MTNKEFEDKKQEIIDKLKAANDYIEWDDKLCASYRVSHASQMIAELQPPEPLTCATCKYFSNYIDHKECECEKSANYCQEISNPQKYVCIRHSDYGAAT